MALSRPATAGDAADRLHMARAIGLAERGRYTTDPNPRVGCVLVRDGQVVGEGWHRRAGEPHAEPLALAQAGERARDATVYVTLEPCSHHGRTPPCAEALIAAGVARVVCAMVDPNPRVAGRGVERLRQAGISVEIGCLESEARALNPGFVKRHEQGRPYVRCKLAASLDGRTALATGESKWITSEAARRDVQRWRAGSSAIVTGLGTVLGDDPSLNVRLTAAELSGMAADDPVRQPCRVVVDSYWRTPPSARLLGLPGRTLIAGIGPHDTAAAALEAAGAELIRLPEQAGRVDLAALMAELAQREVNEVLLEAGSTLSGAAVRAGLVDEILLYQAPCLMGQAAKGLFDLPGIDTMLDRVGLEILEVRSIGRDLRIRARPDL
ncbi:bifunctional diaminohydroxyphosphoribosylaminopyrimidine deaminase/5-amino-6-(5-phosphoribosylamino)uracil reductase RibD [Allochromatium vinosum]|uniref:bifunctional diaminohydroxyphosphoribosylaminopyrimidine deaminase/5-amino-6-(5-phosphoribosylamino)uracil reductase RibD n=1 Tax=Allochromatium vinosum TaxID=1049 RepID=UPI00190341D0|nr:bifunctional diaminohydroxyphosphoribosylaminopyrimidine deaminase/5-amino-6-(5-phosphoribosylamino)uracil reductase RibD [Allochromatium vinosum]MBK1656107.1 riboflavin biosynthesis protein RibD [Allochromatium vinosum]